jgi:hypothetical protein
MQNTKTIGSTWHPASRLLETTISGDVDGDDIAHWERSLNNALLKIEDNSSFKIFVNLHGFTAVNIDAHKRFRSIIPLKLASYGWRVGYVGLFEEEARDIRYTNSRNIQCVAAAHSHHDDTKMTLYETRFANHNEHYFTDPRKALAWIKSVPI